jgi:signal transduction histidine kinase
MFLRQALVNVIHNAIKYSPEGGLVSINVFRDGKPNVIFEIQDNGPGIPIEDQRKVFDRFYRVSKDRGRESGGAGLGLSIAKWAVEAHGGTIALKNGPQTGCICTIAIPGGTQVSPTPLPSRKQTSVPSR